MRTSEVCPRRDNDNKRRANENAVFGRVAWRFPSIAYGSGRSPGFPSRSPGLARPVGAVGRLIISWTTAAAATTTAIRRVLLLIIKHFPGAFAGRWDLCAENVTAVNLDFSEYLPYLHARTTYGGGGVIVG